MHSRARNRHLFPSHDTLRLSPGEGKKQTKHNTIQQLEKRGESVDEKIKKLDAELAKHREIIKKARPGPAQEAAKRRALQVLKQKRMYEGQRESLYNQQFNVEQMSFAAQSAKDTAVQVQAMQAASKAGFRIRGPVYEYSYSSYSFHNLLF